MRWNARTVWLKVHLYLGLTAGAVIVLLGLTGSALVFYEPLDRLLDPEATTAEGSGPRLPLDRIMAAGRVAYPGTAEPTYLLAPGDERGVYVLRFDEPLGSGEVLPIHFSVDPYTGEAVGQRVWNEWLMSWIWQLHYALQLGHAGETVVGIMGVLLVVSLLTGIYLWWPTLRTNVRRAFSVKWSAGGARRNLDLHNASGIYSFLVLLVVAASGVVLIFPAHVQEGLEEVARVTPYPTGFASTPVPGARSVGIGRAAAIADSVFPNAELEFVGLPMGPTGVYVVAAREPGEVGSASGESSVWVDRYSGAVLAVRDWDRLTPADRLLAWMLPLHTGEAFGPVGRGLVFLSGFVPLLLYVTGLRIWWRKRSGRKRREQRLIAQGRAEPEGAPSGPRVAGSGRRSAAL